MAAIGLMIFTAAVAIFSAYHSAPIPYVRQELDYPVRLLGSFGFGLVFSNLEKMAETALKIDRIESHPHHIGFPESVTPHLDALTSMLDEPSSDTVLSDNGCYEEESNEASVTDSPDLPGPTIFIVRESPLTQTIQASPVYEGPVGLVDFTHARRTIPPKSDGFGALNITVNYVVMATIIGLALVLVGYFVFLNAVARAAHGNSVEAVNRASVKATEEIDQIVSDILSRQDLSAQLFQEGDEAVAKTISEISARRTFLLAKVDEADIETDRAIGENSALWTLRRRRKDDMERACERSKVATEQLEAKTEELVRQTLHLPKAEALLSQELDPFRKLVAESKESVDAHVMSARSYIDAEMADATSGELRGRFEAQKKRLAREVEKIEGIQNSCPDIATLRAKYVILDDDIASWSAQVRELEAKVKSRISGLESLHQKSNKMETDVKSLERSLLNLHSCIGLVLQGKIDAEEKLAKIEEGPAVTGGSAADSLPDMPADLERDLLGESSDSVEEETGGEGGEERTEGPEEVAEDSKDAPGPKSPVRKRRPRPSKRARHKLRVRAQAAPPSLAAGGGDDADEAGPSGE